MKKVILASGYNFRYIETKWERVIGDKMTVEGEKYEVICYGAPEELDGAWQLVIKENEKRKYKKRKEEKIIFGNLLIEACGEELLRDAGLIK